MMMMMMLMFQHKVEAKWRYYGTCGILETLEKLDSAKWDVSGIHPKYTKHRPPNCPKDAFLAIAWFEGVELLESHDGHSGTLDMAIKFQKSKWTSNPMKFQIAGPRKILAIWNVYVVFFEEQGWKVIGLQFLSFMFVNSKLFFLIWKQQDFGVRSG